MAWIVVSRTGLVTKGEGEVGMMVASVEIVMFSLDPNSMFVEGYIMGNRVFVGAIKFSEFNMRTESR